VTQGTVPPPAAAWLPLELLDFFEKSLDHVCVAGFDGYFKHLSASWSKTLGYTTEELLAKPSIDFVHPEDRAMTLAGRQRLAVGGELGPLVNRYLCKDGGWRWFEWRSVADPERGLVHCVARDITEQKRAEARLKAAMEVQEELKRQLIFADRMASVGTLAAGVAHEINTPLSFVTTNLSLMLERLQHPVSAGAGLAVEELTQLVTEAMAGAERIRRTVSALKTFSRSEGEQRSVRDVHPLLELSINMTASEIRHRAHLVRDYGETPLVEVDDARLGQVFINLLINAAQAIPEDGTSGHEIRVTTSTDEQGRAVIEVRDTGPGVPVHLATRIFDPFFTTKPVGIGTGLGLSISHSIVTSLGGSITACEHDGPGALFRVVLPPAAAEKIPPRVVATAPPITVTGAPLVARVLVVDDEPAVGVMLGRVLGGHRVTAVTRARDALQLLDSGKLFDVIISDVMMPEMSGVDLYRELCRRFPAYKERFVFLSGGAFSPVIKAFLQSIEAPRIEKPFEPRRIREIVQLVAAGGIR
jgi:PAS domain S-box-containing protein